MSSFITPARTITRTSTVRQGDAQIAVEVASSLDEKVWNIFQPFQLSNFPRSTMWKWTSTSRSVLVHLPHCGKWKVGKFGKHAPAVATLVHSPLPITARENKDRSAQSVQDQASLSPAATRAGFSSPPRPQICIAHGIRSVALGHD